MAYEMIETILDAFLLSMHKNKTKEGIRKRSKCHMMKYKTFLFSHIAFIFRGLVFVFQKRMIYKSFLIVIVALILHKSWSILLLDLFFLFSHFGLKMHPLGSMF